MKVDAIGVNNISFKSGYPTFGTGHLSKLGDDPILFTGVYYKPIPDKGGILKRKLDLYA